MLQCFRAVNFDDDRYPKPGPFTLRLKTDIGMGIILHQVIVEASWFERGTRTVVNFPDTSI